MTRQEQELMSALDCARRAAGRAESRARLRGEPFIAKLAAQARSTVETQSGVFEYVHKQLDRHGVAA
jgi:hypothetical protein